jgi:hypothetical protein
MLSITNRIENFAALGNWLNASLTELSEGKKPELAQIIDKAGAQNPWFTQSSIIQSLGAIAGWLNKQTLNEWVNRYYLTNPVQVKEVAVIMAGNVPVVNFHDFLSVLITGHKFIGKLSSQDKVLLPFLAEKLIELDPNWKSFISFTEDRLTHFDAVIATGSNNTSRYFEYYLGKYPHIIRKNRNSIAILTGNESEEELKTLYNDVFQYFGLGCRNVSMFLVPKGYDFPVLFDLWQGNPEPTDHNKYKNNYDYYRSLYLVNLQPFYDTGYVSVIRSESIASPISVLHYKEYEDLEEVNGFLKSQQDQIQCVVSAVSWDTFPNVLPGQAQCPSILDYPDGVDIVQFLLAL